MAQRIKMINYKRALFMANVDRQSRRRRNEVFIENLSELWSNDEINKPVLRENYINKNTKILNADVKINSVALMIKVANVCQNIIDSKTDHSNQD